MGHAAFILWVTSKNSLDGESMVIFPPCVTYFSSRSSTTRAKKFYHLTKNALMARSPIEFLEIPYGCTFFANVSSNHPVEYRRLTNRGRRCRIRSVLLQ